MGAWGKNSSSSSFKSCDALFQRVRQNDARLIELIILPMKTFGPKELLELSKILQSGVNTNLMTLSASGHTIYSTEAKEKEGQGQEKGQAALEALGQAIASGKSKLTNIAIGDSSLGDDGVAALCKGLSMMTDIPPEQVVLKSLDLSWKGIGPTGLITILQTLGTNRYLTTLNLSRNPNLGTISMNDELVSFFNDDTNDQEQQQRQRRRFFPSLDMLDISNCGMTYECCHGILSRIVSTSNETKATTTSASSSSSSDGLVLKLNSNPNMIYESQEGNTSTTSATRRSISTIFSSIMNLSSLTELYLSKCNLGDDGLEQFINSIGIINTASSTTTTSTETRQVRTTTEHHDYVYGMKIRLLDISHNNLSSKGLSLFAKHLGGNDDDDDKEQQNVGNGNNFLPNLESLYLSGNKFDESSTVSLAHALGRRYTKSISTGTGTSTSTASTGDAVPTKQLRSLIVLDMTDTCCGIQGAVELIRTSMVQDLTLFKNNLRTDGFIAMGKALRGGHATLHTLDIGGNHSSEVGVATMLQSITMMRRDDGTDNNESSTSAPASQPNENENEDMVNRLRLIVVGGNETGPSVENAVQEIRKIYPQLDIARDKPRRQ